MAAGALACLHPPSLTLSTQCSSITAVVPLDGSAILELIVGPLQDFQDQKVQLGFKTVLACTDHLLSASLCQLVFYIVAPLYLPTSLSSHSKPMQALELWPLDLAPVVRQCALGKLATENFGMWGDGAGTQLLTVGFNASPFCPSQTPLMPLHPYFIFDGPDCPHLKRGKDIVCTCYLPLLMQHFQELLTAFGFNWHMALGEAEVELTCLQSCTLINVVAMLYNNVLLFDSGIPPSGKYEDMPLYSSDALQNCTSLKWGDLLLVTLMSSVDSETGCQWCSTDVAHKLVNYGFGKTLFEATIMLQFMEFMEFIASATMFTLLQLPGNVDSKWLQHGLWVLSHSDKSYKLSVLSLPLETPVDKDPLPAYEIEMLAVMLEYSRPDLVELTVNPLHETGVIDLLEPLVSWIRTSHLPSIHFYSIVLVYHYELNHTHCGLLGNSRGIFIGFTHLKGKKKKIMQLIPKAGYYKFWEGSDGPEISIQVAECRRKGMSNDIHYDGTVCNSLGDLIQLTYREDRMHGSVAGSWSSYPDPTSTTPKNSTFVESFFTIPDDEGSIKMKMEWVLETDGTIHNAPTSFPMTASSTMYTN
ncbi:hypothetical protein F5J12DRAFT_787596 [Pisolithus orientalis]|uniref:uncharacterized protein n=1 Tax=Pisolithus orientalis TaxID=936130 RepID=UPI002223F999|nr:uncharacterized protein F5J12DRAFT_787596 [Pisolithus orientalis]KAI5984246.1 hypothetical protein F5J12DRAFT_787596 [Pisolithus orientalis]